MTGSIAVSIAKTNEAVAAAVAADVAASGA